MYIKSIILHGFKSYGSKTVVDAFSPSMNCIVGSNGSGKSNVLHALRYILSEDMYSITEAEKSTVLYKGMQNVKSAYVEIVFDNSDGRIPISEEEVRIRRTLGMKDEFAINDKKARKADITKLFEGAAMYGTDSYFAVSGDTLVSPSFLNPSEILHKLKSVAGTTIYEERRGESLKLLEETDDRLDKIQETLQYIEDRLKELEEEKAELQEWQELDHKKRGLEYAINDRDLNEARDVLQNLESRREEESGKSRKLHSDMNKLKEQIEESTRNMKMLNSDKILLERREENLEEEVTREASNKARVEILRKEAEAALEKAVSRTVDLNKEKDELLKLSKKEERELNRLVPEYNSCLSLERELLEKHKNILKRHQLLLDMTTNKFQTKKERDAWVKGQEQKLQEEMKSAKKVQQQLEKDVKVVKARIASGEQELADRLREGGTKGVVERSKAELAALTKERNKLHDRRKELWRKEDALETDLNQMRLRVQKVETSFSNTVNKHTWTGVELVEKIAAEKSIEGVLGPVYDLFSCHNSLYAAVEAAARNSLFNVVVDSDDVVSELLDEMEKYNAGRVTIVPLNKLNPSDRKLPSNEDVFPLISKLKFDPKVAPVMKHIFGKYLVCRDAEVAFGYSMEEKVNCVTLEGDHVSKGGAITGGGRQQTSRMKLVKLRTGYQKELEDISQSKTKNEEEISQLETRISSLIGEMEALERKVSDLSASRGDFKSEISLLRSEIALWSEDLDRKQEQQKGAEIDMQQILESKSFLAEMAKATFKKNTEEEDESEIERLGLDAQRIKSELMKTSARRETLESECYSKRNKIKQDLSKRVEEIDMELKSNEDELSSLRKSPLELEEEENSTAKRLEGLFSQKKMVELDLESAQQRLKDSEMTLEELQTTEKTLEQEILNQSKQLDRIVNRRNNYIQKKEEIVNRIRTIGNLPSESIETYGDLSMRELLRELKDTKDKLKKYEYVNKKALLQYLNFSKERNSLVDRKESLAKEAESIRELIQHLDMQKDEAIVKTFNGVAGHFAEIINELVPNCNGRLRISADVDADGKPQLFEEARQDNLRFITGVVPEVAFGNEGTDHGIFNLSGGQRALLSLAIMLSIQRFNPFPFYILDEVDKSLDPEFRLAVANLLRKEAQKAQFIVITFNEEIVHVSERYYIVQFNQDMKISTISSCEKATVIELIDKEKGAKAREQSDV